VRGAFAIPVLAGLLVQASPAQEASSPDALTLRAAVEIARAGHPAALAAEAEVLAVSQNVRKAVAEGYLPRLALGAYSGLVPEARGDIFSSPDLQTDLDGLGVFWRLNLGLIQPITTFGRAGAAVTAARESSVAAAFRRDAILEQLSVEVVKAYWGVLAAEEAGRLARESGDRYRELLEEIENRLARDDSEVDDGDLLEAQSHELEIETLIQSSLEKRDLAVRAFNILLDREAGSSVALVPLDPPGFEAAEEMGRRMILVALDESPEVRALTAAARASEAKVKAIGRKAWPMLYLAGEFGLARAPNRQDQTNPFVVDNFNYRNLGLALGLRWEPDLFARPADVRQAEAEHKALIGRLAACRDKVELDAARAFAQARRNARLLEAARRSLAAAKSWLRLSQENWDTGFGDAYRLLRAYRSYFELRSASVEREYELNISLAELARVMGDAGRYLDWVERGKVVLD